MSESDSFYRGLVHDEITDIRTAMAAFQIVVRAIGHAARTCFARNRRMSGEALEELVSVVDVNVTQGLNPLDRTLERRLPTFARPKGEIVELSYLVVVPEARDETSAAYLRLTALRIHATRKKVVLDVIPTPFGCGMHAAMRFAERGTDVYRSIRHLSSGLAEWIALPGIVRTPMEADGYDRLAFPTPYGMLCGTIDNRRPPPSGTRRIIGREGSGGGSLSLAWNDPGFSVQTFVGRRNMRPDQVFAMALLEEWRREREASLRDAGRRLYWPTRELVSLDVARDDHGLASAAGLLTQERMLRAMGNGAAQARKASSDAAGMIPGR